MLSFKRSTSVLIAAAMLCGAFTAPVYADYDDYDSVYEFSESFDVTEGDELDLSTYVETDPSDYTWKSDDTSVATVSKGNVKAKKPGLVVITATNDYEEGTFYVSVAEKSQNSVKEYTQNIQMEKGEELDLSDYVELSPSSYSWNSDSTNIAAISRGVVTAKQAGLAVITATGDYEKVTFYVSVAENSTYGTDGTSYVDVQAGIGETIDLHDLYLNELASLYSWTSSDNSVATVNSAGKVTTKSSGQATIYADAPYGYQDYCFNLKVNNSTSGVTTKSISVAKGDTYDLTDQVAGSASSFDWVSDDKGIATVSSSGVVKGISKGTTSIYVYYKGATTESYKFNVTVKSSSSSSSSSSNNFSEKYTIYMGKSDSVDISDLLAKTAGNYDWETSNSDICKVSGSNLKAVGTGTATIKALGSKNYQFKVNIDKAYNNYAVAVKPTLDISKYIEEDSSRYNISYFDTGIVNVKDNTLTGLKNGFTYVIFENKKTNEVVQFMVTVSGVAQNVETTTQATTQQPTAAAAPAAQTSVGGSMPNFLDISHRAWAVAAINNMASKGYINGRNSTTFAPDDQCSKADFTIVLTKMLGIENDNYSGSFDDVNSSKYYAKYVNVARQHGICAGVVGNSFKPETAITREEVMYMVYKGLLLKGRNMNNDTSVLASYSDSSKISDDYKVAVAALLNGGIVSGVSSTEVDPKSTITRAQMAVLLNNLGY